MIIDTNIYDGLKSGRDQKLLGITDGISTFYIPIFVLAELRFGFALGSKTIENEKQLVQFIASENVEVIEPNIDTTFHYGRVATFARKNGISLSQNDIWIAALSLQHKIPLITLDQDFLSIKELLKDLVFVES